MRPNGLPFSRRECAAYDHSKIATISRAKQSAGTFGSQILVFHFPGVIERVKGGVPNQEPQRPFRLLASLLALGVVVPDCLAISITIRPQFLVSQQRIVGGDNP